MRQKRNQQAKSAQGQEGSRRAILDKAARLLRDRGYTSTSLRDIAAAAGMQAGSLYYHFDSKEDLVREVLSLGTALVEERVRGALAGEAESAGALDMIRTAMTAHLQALHDKGDYASANIRCYGHVPKELKAHLRKARSSYEELWTGLIGRAQACGDLREDIDPEALRLAIIGMLNWTLEWRRSVAPSPRELAASLYDIVIEGARRVPG